MFSTSAFLLNPDSSGDDSESDGEDSAQAKRLKQEYILKKLREKE